MLPSLDHARTALARAETALRNATLKAGLADGDVIGAQRVAQSAWDEVAVCNASVEALRQQIEFDEGVLAAVAARTAENTAAAH